MTVTKKDIPKSPIKVYVLLDTNDNSFKVVRTRREAAEMLNMYPGQYVCYPVDEGEYYTLNVTMGTKTFDPDLVEENGVANLDEVII